MRAHFFDGTKPFSRRLGSQRITAVRPTWRNSLVTRPYAHVREAPAKSLAQTTCTSSRRQQLSPSLSRTCNAGTFPFATARKLFHCYCAWAWIPILKPCTLVLRLTDFQNPHPCFFLSFLAQVQVLLSTKLKSYCSYCGGKAYSFFFTMLRYYY